MIKLIPKNKTPQQFSKFAQTHNKTFFVIIFTFMFSHLHAKIIFLRNIKVKIKTVIFCRLFPLMITFYSRNQYAGNTAQLPYHYKAIVLYCYGKYLLKKQILSISYQELKSILTYLGNYDLDYQPPIRASHLRHIIIVEQMCPQTQEHSITRSSSITLINRDRREACIGNY